MVAIPPKAPWLSAPTLSASEVEQASKASKDAHFKDKPKGVPTPAEVAEKMVADFFARTPRDLLSKPVPQPFEFDEAPPPIAQFAHAHSRATGFDHSAMIVAATTAAAAIIDDRYMLEVNPRIGWTTSARLWSVLLAPPGTGKSPAMRPAINPIKQLHGELAARWRAENDELKPQDKAPMPALFTSNATIEAIQERLKDNHQGILMTTEEIGSWLGGIESSDKGEATANRAYWLQLRDGGPQQIDRVGRGSVYVPNWGASVLAAGTPDSLAKLMKNMPEDGLIQRFIPCIMGQSNLDANGDSAAEIAQWENYVRWAYNLTSRHHVRIQFNAEARELYEAERKAQRQMAEACQDFAPSYASHISKHPGMLAEVALTFHVFSGRSAGPEIDAETMGYAIRFMRRVRKHAYHLYAAILDPSPAFKMAQAIARSIVAEDKPITTIDRNWMSQHANGFRKADDRLRQSALEILQDADWIATFTGGRIYGGVPAKYSVHPKVFQLFAHEGEMHRARRAAVVELIKERN